MAIIKNGKIKKLFKGCIERKIYFIAIKVQLIEIYKRYPILIARKINYVYINKREKVISMIKKLSKLCLMLFMGATILTAKTEAGAAEFEAEKFKVNLSEHNMSMNIESDNGFYYYQHEEVDDGMGGYKEYIHKYTADKSGVKEVQTFGANVPYLSCAKEINKQGDIIVAGETKHGVINFSTYDKNGVLLSQIEDKIKTKEYVMVNNILVKDNLLYYVYRTDYSKPHIRCINLQNGKVVKTTHLKYDSTVSEIEIYGDRVYIISKNSVKSCTLNGKNIKTYKLPKVKRNNYERIAVNKKYIYYTNGKNGVYRCKINNPKSKFKLFYNGKKDKKFNGKLLHDICVDNSNKIYMTFYDKKDIDRYGPTELVVYQTGR